MPQCYLTQPHGSPDPGEASCLALAASGGLISATDDLAGSRKCSWSGLATWSTCTCCW